MLKREQIGRSKRLNHSSPKCDGGFQNKFSICRKQRQKSSSRWQRRLRQLPAAALAVDGRCECGSRRQHWLTAAAISNVSMAAEAVMAAAEVAADCFSSGTRRLKASRMFSLIPNSGSMAVFSSGRRVLCFTKNSKEK